MTTTTQTVDDVLRDLASRGEITHISLTPSQNGKFWRASFAMSSKFGISYAEDADPARAIIEACTTAKMKPRREVRVRDEVAVIPQETVEVTPSRDGLLAAADAVDAFNDGLPDPCA